MLWQSGLEVLAQGADRKHHCLFCDDVADETFLAPCILTGEGDAFTHLRVLSEARKAFSGCTHAIHLAGIVEGVGSPHTLTEVNNALANAVVRAALDEDVARFVYVSSSTVYEAAVEFPTREDHHPYANDTFYGAAKAFNEGMLRSFHSMYGLD